MSWPGGSGRAPVRSPAGGGAWGRSRLSPAAVGWMDRWNWKFFLVVVDRCERDPEVGERQWQRRLDRGGFGSRRRWLVRWIWEDPEEGGSWSAGGGDGMDGLD